MDMLPEEMDNRINAELRDGERLVWAGQPIPGRFVRASIPMVLFGIPWTAFAVFWVAAASGMMFGGPANNGPGGFFACFPLFGVPFILIGLAMLSSPFWMRRRALQTCYALTDQRAIIWAAGWWGGTEVRSYQAVHLDKMTRRQFADGSGDLIFEEFVTMDRHSNGGWRTNRTERGFVGIDNVREVEDLVRRTLLPGS